VTTTSKSTFGDEALRFYETAARPRNLPADVHVIDPYRDAEVHRCMQLYFSTYFSDGAPRVFVLGINPGRFGSGVTGIPFADPISLHTLYGIQSTLEGKQELSAQFIEQFIGHWGGPHDFYKHFYITAMSPFGLIKGGQNYNYYDDPKVFEVLKPQIVAWLQRQLSFGASTTAIVFGKGKNSKALSGLNDVHRWFERILTLEHPRYVMQYKRAALPQYLDMYKQTFTEALES